MHQRGWQAGRIGVLVCVLAVLLVPSAALGAAGRAPSRVLVSIAGDGLSDGETAEIAAALKRAFTSDPTLSVVTGAEVAEELAGSTARAGAVREARVILEGALRLYRAFDYAGALAKLPLARQTCIGIATVGDCRDLLFESLLSEAAALLARDGKLGEDGRAALAAAYSLAPDRKLPPEEYRPEIVSRFAALAKLPMRTIPLEAPPAGVVLVDGRPAARLPASSLTLREGIHYVELVSLGTARSVVQVQVTTATRLKVKTGGLDPDTLGREVGEALRHGLVPKMAADAAMVARLASLNAVVTVRARRDGPTALSLEGTALFGEGAAKGPTSVIVTSTRSAPPRGWLAGLVGGSATLSPVAPSDTEIIERPRKRRRGVNPWLMLGIGVSGGAAVTLVTLLLLIPPRDTRAVYWTVR